GARVQNTTEDGRLRGQPGPMQHGEDLTLIVCGADGPRSVSLRAGGELVIGRHDSCQLSLPIPTLSRFHARFVRRGESVTVEDLGSRHGTWLSGQRIERAELQPGSAVRLADVVVAVARGTHAGFALAADRRAAPGSTALYLSPRMREL